MSLIGPGSAPCRATAALPMIHQSSCACAMASARDATALTKSLSANSRLHDLARLCRRNSTLAIIDVHLAAEAFDPIGFRGPLERRGRFHEARAFSGKSYEVQSVRAFGDWSTNLNLGTMLPGANIAPGAITAFAPTRVPSPRRAPNLLL